MILASKVNEHAPFPANEPWFELWSRCMEISFYYTTTFDKQSLTRFSLARSELNRLLPLRPDMRNDAAAMLNPNNCLRLFHAGVLQCFGFRCLACTSISETCQKQFASAWHDFYSSDIFCMRSLARFAAATPSHPLLDACRCAIVATRFCALLLGHEFWQRVANSNVVHCSHVDTRQSAPLSCQVAPLINCTYWRRDG